MLTTSRPPAAPISGKGARNLALAAAGVVGLVVLGVVAQLPIGVIVAVVALPAVVAAVAVMMKRPELLMPIAFGSMWFEGLGVGQLRLGRIIALVLFVMPVLLALSTGWRPPALQARAWAPSYIVILWVWFSGLWALNQIFWVSSVGQYLVGWAYLLGCLLFIESFDQALRLLRIWLWVGIPVALLSDFTYFLLAPTIREGEEVRVFGFSGSANNFGVYLVVAVVMSIAMSRMTTGRERLIYRLMVPLFVSGLVTSGSRASLIALGLIAFYVVATVEGIGIIRRVGTILGGTVLILAAGIVLIIINPRLNPLAAIATGASGRLDIQVLGVAAAKDHWAFGVGAGNFPSVSIDYAFTTTGASLTELRRITQGSLQPFIHNLYVSLVAELGIGGLLIYLGFLASGFKNNWDLRRSEWKHISWAVTGALLMFLFFAAQSPVGNQKMQWSLIGIVGGVYVRRRRRPSNFRISEVERIDRSDEGDDIDDIDGIDARPIDDRELV